MGAEMNKVIRIMQNALNVTTKALMGSREYWKAVSDYRQAQKDLEALQQAERNFKEVFGHNVNY